MPKTTTLRQIASKAGVSPSTVSRVLSGRAAENRIPTATVERVRRLAGQAGYRPNLYARYLKTQRSHTIGVLVTEIGNPFFATVIDAVEQVARRRGYTLVIAASGEDRARTLEYLALLGERPVDGLIVVPTEGGEVARRLLSLRRRGTPVVLVDRELPPHRFDAVVTDSRGGMAGLVEALWGFGSRRPALIGGPRSVWTARERQAGFRVGIRRSGLQSAAGVTVCGPYSRTYGAEAACRLMGSGSPPDAIVAANNSILLGVLDALREMGRRAARLPVAGFDGVPFAHLLGRPMAIAEQPAAGIGRAAAERLIERIEGRPGPPETVCLSVTLRVHGLARAKEGEHERTSRDLLAG
jgi:LacI family transcriptional regulator